MSLSSIDPFSINIAKIGIRTLAPLKLVNFYFIKLLVSDSLPINVKGSIIIYFCASGELDFAIIHKVCTEYDQLGHTELGSITLQFITPGTMSTEVLKFILLAKQQFNKNK